MSESFEVSVTEVSALDVTVIEGPNPRVEVGVSPSTPSVLEVRVPGPAGPRGEKGDPGDVAPGSGDLSYVHVQISLSSLWRMEHGMGRKSTPDVYDTAGRRWFPDITHESANVALADFGRLEVAGTAYFD